MPGPLQSRWGIATLMPGPLQSRWGIAPETNRRQGGHIALYDVGPAEVETPYETLHRVARDPLLRHMGESSN
jgi:hypothetical protein